VKNFRGYVISSKHDQF